MQATRLDLTVANYISVTSRGSVCGKIVRMLASTCKLHRHYGAGSGSFGVRIYAQTTTATITPKTISTPAETNRDCAKFLTCILPFRRVKWRTESRALGMKYGQDILAMLFLLALLIGLMRFSDRDRRP